MRGSELADVMAVALDHLVNARESSVGLDRAIETIVGTDAPTEAQEDRRGRLGVGLRKCP